MNGLVTVIYSTECFAHRNGNRAGIQREHRFGSLQAARCAALPEGYVSAFIAEEKGYHSYSARFGWEYYPKEGSRQ